MDPSGEKKKNKKIFIIVFIVVSIILVFVTLFIEHKLLKGDTDNNDSSETRQADKNNKKNKVETQEGNTKNITINRVESDFKPTETPSVEDSDKINEGTFKLEKNKKNTIKDKYSITYIDSSFQKIVNPPNTSSYYRYYDSEEGHQYLVLKVDYENLTAYGVKASEVATAKLKYADKYEYSSFSVILDADNEFDSSSYTNINPFTTGHLYYLFDVPDIVATSKESVDVTVMVGQNSYEIKVR